MPSSTPESSNKRGRLLKYLIGALVLLGALYTGGWYYLANELQTRVATNIAAFKEKGIDATCENARASGYPLRVGLDCTRVGWADPAKNLSVTAGTFRSAAQVYDPMQIVSRIDGPAAIDVPGADAARRQMGKSRLQHPLGQTAPQADIDRRQQFHRQPARCGTGCCTDRRGTGRRTALQHHRTANGCRPFVQQAENRRQSHRQPVPCPN